MKFAEMNAAERPRERLLAKGAEALSEGELLAILLRSGRRGENALDMARRLLSEAGGSLTTLFEGGSELLSGVCGVGPSKAASLLAAFELGRRFVEEQGVGRGLEVRHSGQIFRRMLPRLKGLRHEECWIVLLDVRCRIIDIRRMTVGGGRKTIVDPQAIVRAALEKAASGIILIHNHPDGDPRPSEADIRETSAMRLAASSCSLNLLDHIVVADEHYYSFSDEVVY